MQPRSIRAETQKIWQRHRKLLMKQFGESAEKMALAEILVLRQLALSALSAQTMTELRSPAKIPDKKLTR